MRLIQDISRKAGEAGLSFLVIGGYAVLAHGYTRTTDDLDLLAQSVRRSDWMKLMTELGMSVKSDAPTFLQFDPASDARIGVDLMFVSESAFSKMDQAAVVSKAEGVSVRVVALLHLIALKCHALQHSKALRRLKDMDDLIYLILINRLDLNEPELQATILKHGNQELYENLRHACADE